MKKLTMLLILAITMSFTVVARAAESTNSLRLCSIMGNMAVGVSKVRQKGWSRTAAFDASVAQVPYNATSTRIMIGATVDAVYYQNPMYIDASELYQQVTTTCQLAARNAASK